jgi:hypothetical protein
VTAIQQPVLSFGTPYFEQSLLVIEPVWYKNFVQLKIGDASATAEGLAA